MKILIKKTIGNTEYTFEIEDEKGLEALSLAGFLAEMPSKCSLCGSEEVCLSSNKAKGYTFVKVKCLKCNARAQLGSYKDGGYFWKNFEKYQPPVNQETS
jgi:hypothetical protein